MDGRRIRNKKVAFSSENACVWTGRKNNECVFLHAVLLKLFLLFFFFVLFFFFFFFCNMRPLKLKTQLTIEFLAAFNQNYGDSQRNLKKNSNKQNGLKSANHN